jgi:homoserine kinase
MEDVVIEPVRSILIPGFDEVKKRCLETGALGGGIAGSGPSVFMLSRNRDTALKIELAMRRMYGELGLNHTTYVSTVNPSGCTIIE